MGVFFTCLLLAYHFNDLPLVMGKRMGRESVKTVHNTVAKSSEIGIKTRLEAFYDMLEMRKNK